MHSLVWQSIADAVQAADGHCPLLCRLLLRCCRCCQQACSHLTKPFPELCRPYYLEEDLFRQNITEGQAGVPLELRITILDTDCNPLDGVFVDIWHANATGEYSG